MWFGLRCDGSCRRHCQRCTTPTSSVNQSVVNCFAERAERKTLIVLGRELRECECGRESGNESKAQANSWR